MILCAVQGCVGWDCVLCRGLGGDCVCCAGVCER